MRVQYLYKLLYLHTVLNEALRLYCGPTNKGYHGFSPVDNNVGQWIYCFFFSGSAFGLSTSPKLTRRPLSSIKLHKHHR